MAEEKKSDKKRETKAGLLEKNDSRTTSAKNRKTKKGDAESTPTISKDKAGNHNNEPLH